jgi:hypothetical protein
MAAGHTYDPDASIAGWQPAGEDGDKGAGQHYLRRFIRNLIFIITVLNFFLRERDRLHL